MPTFALSTHLKAHSAKNVLVGGKALVHCHGFRSFTGSHFAVPAGMDVYFYVQSGYSLLHTPEQRTGRDFRRHVNVTDLVSTEMACVALGMAAPVQHYAAGVACPEYMLSKDDSIPYTGLMVDVKYRFPPGWGEIVTVRGRTGTPFVSFSYAVRTLAANGYNEAHCYFCRSSVRHPNRSQWPGGGAGNQARPYMTF